jgi:hypothetical protein
MGSLVVERVIVYRKPDDSGLAYFSGTVIGGFGAGRTFDPLGVSRMFTVTSPGAKAMVKVPFG